MACAVIVAQPVTSLVGLSLACRIYVASHWAAYWFRANPSCRFGVLELWSMENWRDLQRKTGVCFENVQAMGHEASGGDSALSQSGSPGLYRAL